MELGVSWLFCVLVVAVVVGRDDADLSAARCWCSAWRTASDTRITQAHSSAVEMRQRWS